MTAFARVTETHDLLSIAITPCAGQLYRWLLRKVPAGKPQEFFLQDFRNWSEQSRTKPYSMRHIQRSLTELIDSGVIQIVQRYTSKIYKLICTHPDPPTTLDKKVQNLDQKVQNWTQMSKTGTSNPDSAVALNREYKETTDTPTLHPVSNVEEKINNKENLLSLNIPLQNTAEIRLDGIPTSPNTPTEQDPLPLEKVPLFSEKRKIEPEPDPPDPKEHPIDPQLLSDVKAVIAPMPLNANLKRVIQDAEPEAVRNAIAVVKENQARGTVNRPAGLLSMAIRRQWTPNEERPTIPDGFSEWFDLAREKGVVAASTIMAGEMMVCVDLARGDWKPWTEISAAFTLGYLRRMSPLGAP